MESLKEMMANLAPDSLLMALEPEQIEALLKNATRKDLKPDDVVINQGDENGDYAVYVLSGGLKISFVSASGREIILSYCSPGEVIGEIALLDSEPRTATATAVVESSVLLLPSKQFLEAVSSNPTSVARIMRELAQRVRQQNLIIESDRTFSMGPRLARALVRLIDKDRNDGGLLYNPSQSDLGAFAGLARENVSRLLSEWESQGIIARDGRTLSVRDIEYLRSLAEFGEKV
ncbi:transcriptional regulator, Crp/Fnr family protein [Erythrobacter sp. NAP1]|uniref:Crp/Fnr family transcriptional regulator n=1 Tax=Erythrobacter sp. NAP1 TaxID=237727 RepID=UPI00006851BA|nr:Crp/Fnr family transcriptional regulator [Erythrobacter sp. NAP1]EAQ27694.1 transcriptional regulator, Crp/Fnr family protein [Erythrobacter sp. NAP1]